MRDSVTWKSNGTRFSGLRKGVVLDEGFSDVKTIMRHVSERALLEEG